MKRQAKLIEEQLLLDFCHWMKLLGYQQTTIYAAKSHLKALLIYLEQNGLTLGSESVQGYIEYIPHRPKFKKGQGCLSANALVGVYRTIHLLAEFCLLVKKQYLEIWTPPLKRTPAYKKPLTVEQIQLVYAAIDTEKDKALRLRDRAIIALLYGCGMRRGEVQKLQLGHLLFRQRLVFVTAGKTGQQRYVPLTDNLITDLKNYIYEGRYAALPPYQHYLITSGYGKALSKPMYQTRVKKWEQRAQLKRPLTPHIFRHSIATHLLQAGMPLEQVSNFLGHRTLAATQLYTHIV